MNNKNFLKDIQNRNNNKNPYLSNENIEMDNINNLSLEKEKNENIIIKNSTKEEREKDDKLNQQQIIIVSKQLNKGRPLGAKKRSEPVERVSLTLPSSLYNRIKAKILITPQLTLSDVIRESLDEYCKKNRI